MKEQVLFGVVYSKNGDGIWIVRGLFEKEESWFSFSPDTFKASNRIYSDLSVPESGNVVAFLAIEEDETSIFDEMPDAEQNEIYLIVGVLRRPPFHLHKGLLKEKFESAALVDAVEDSDLAKVRELLDSGAKPDSVNQNGDTALLRSIGKNTQITSLLVAYGADPSVPNGQGVTPLRYAVDGHSASLLILEKSPDQLETIQWLNHITNAVKKAFGS